MLKEAGIKVPDMEATVVRKSFSVQGPNGVGSTMQILSYTKIVNMYRLCVCVHAFGVLGWMLSMV